MFFELIAVKHHRVIILLRIFFFLQVVIVFPVKALKALYINKCTYLL